MKRLACFIAVLVICSCEQEARVGEWYEDLSTKRLVKIELIGSLDEVKAFADTFYNQCLRRELTGYAAKESLTTLNHMRISLIKSLYSIRLERVGARYRELAPYKDEKFFLHYAGDNDEEVVFKPIADLQNDYRKVEAVE